MSSPTTIFDIVVTPDTNVEAQVDADVFVDVILEGPPGPTGPPGTLPPVIDLGGPNDTNGA